ncbi:hypothetical protein HHK36_007835 [Tetracentron sinense]|uniref:Protein FAR1-RELATED SEQUENCE n=1 Tax=Tetracentron sinense TaxID=13715 RepID=A0A834ZIG7_TETSI|nr:hypothetical protein HHK36_007835 [Tetracentron sinense]
MQQMRKNLSNQQRDESSFIEEGNLIDTEIMTTISRYSWDCINKFGSPYWSSFNRASYSPNSLVCREAKKYLWLLILSVGRLIIESSMEENVGCSMNSYAGDYEMAPNEVITDINTSEILEGCMIENEIIAEPSTMEQNNEHFIGDNVTFEDEIVEQCKVIGSVKNYIPKVGMEFETEKEAHAFYNYYAMKEGFGIKIKSSHVRKSTQELCHVLFACCKEGFTNRIAITQYSRPDTRTGCKARLRVKLTDYKKWRVTEVNIEHNHQVTPKKARFYKSHKHLDAGSKRRLELNNEAGIRFNKSYHSLVVDAGGYEKLSFGEKECRNHIDRKWVPVYLKDTFYAGMSTTQRSESMNAFFDKYVNSQTYLKEFVDKYEMALKDKYEKEMKADFESFNGCPVLTTECCFEIQLSKVYTKGIFKKFQRERYDNLYQLAIHLVEEGAISQHTYEVAFRALKKACSEVKSEIEYTKNTHVGSCSGNENICEGIECNPWSEDHNIIRDPLRVTRKGRPTGKRNKPAYEKKTNKAKKLKTGPTTLSSHTNQYNTQENIQHMVQQVVSEPAIGNESFMQLLIDQVMRLGVKYYVQSFSKN